MSEENEPRCGLCRGMLPHGYPECAHILAATVGRLESELREASEEVRLRYATHVMCNRVLRDEMPKLKADAEKDYAEMRRFQSLYINADHARIAAESALSAERTARRVMREALDALLTAKNPDSLEMARAALAAEPGEGGPTARCAWCDHLREKHSETLGCVAILGDCPCTTWQPPAHLSPEEHPRAAEVKNEG